MICVFTTTVLMIMCITFKHTGVFSVEVNREYEVILDSQVELSCTVRAVPPEIFVTWSRVVDGNEVTVKVQNTVEGNVAVLQRNITLMDNGTWRCRAGNTAGGDMEDFDVTVLGKTICKISLIFTPQGMFKILKL